MQEEITRHKILKGGAFLLAARMVDRLVGFASITILARLLTPADFGIVAIAGTVVTAVQLFTQFGFDWALVRYRELSPSDLNTAWTLRVLLGLGVFVVLSLSGPWAAAFYHQQVLKEILFVLGFASFVGSLENIGTVYFRRDFQFHKEFLLQSVARLIGFVATLTTAIVLRSYWALVTGMLATRAASALMSYFIHPYRPRFGLRRARELFSFSSWLLAGNIAEYCRERFADLYLGRVFGPSATGLLSVAGEISVVPLTEIASPANRVAFSKYSEDVRENRSLKSSYLGIASLIWLVALPMAAGTVAVAPEIVALLLGPRWTAAEPVLRLLAVGMTFTVMAANTHYVYWALGYSRVVAGLSMSSAAIIVPLTFVGAHFAGYVGVAWAFTIQSAFIVPVNFVLLRRIADIRFMELWRRVWRVTLGAAIMLLTLNVLFPEHTQYGFAAAFGKLLLEVPAGGVIYVIVVVGTWQLAGRPEGPEATALQLLRERVIRGREDRYGKIGAP